MLNSAMKKRQNCWLLICEGGFVLYKFMNETEITYCRATSYCNGLSSLQILTIKNLYLVNETYQNNQKFVSGKRNLSEIISKIIKIISSWIFAVKRNKILYIYNSEEQIGFKISLI